MLSLILVAALGAIDCQVGSCVGDGFEVWDGRDLGCCIDRSNGGDAVPRKPLVRFVGEGGTSCADPHFLAVVARVLNECAERIAPETTSSIFANRGERAPAFVLQTFQKEVQRCFAGKSFSFPAPHLFERSCSLEAYFMEPRTALTAPSSIEAPPPEILEVRKSPTGEAKNFYDAGVRLLQAQDNIEAIAILEKCITADPAAAMCHRALGIAYARMKNGPKAVKHYQQYLKSFPDAPDGDQVRALWHHEPWD